MGRKELEVLDELECISQKGTVLYLDGEPATPSQVAGSCVNSGSLYMPDFIIDDEGILREVRYDKISHV